MNIKENIQKFEEQLKGTHCKLVAVSKTKPLDMLQEAYEAGMRRFGENKVQELADKAEKMPTDIQWHMIGHLQRNKVKYIAPFVHLIHAVDSLRLLKEIDKQARKNERTISCLLQLHIAEEETKFGLNKEEVYELLHSEEFKALNNVRIVGLMGMATNTEDKDQVRKEFHSLKQLFEELSAEDLGDKVKMEELSMGMSNDYPIAIEEGSTLIRVGSAIFGARNY